MLIFRGISSNRAAPRRRAVTIGNFDGVHRGHQALINQARAEATAGSLICTVLTFEPHPKAFFQPAKAPAKIQGLRDKAKALADLGVDEFWILPFRRSLAEMTAEDFMEKVLHQTLAAKSLVIGDDFCFGAKRRGNHDLLAQAASAYDWTIARMPSVSVQGERASSSALRAALGRGDLQAVARLMGRPYSLSGYVIHGQKLGRSLGFPTLNIPVPASLCLSGILIASVHGLSDGPLAAVASIGHRPTVASAGHLLLEVHCLDWSGDAYGKIVTVEIHQKIRDEVKYDGLAEMTDQIRKDAQTARDYFNQHVHS
jgi:riboflavin kinase/FMN adenylyltransferase